jgi:hypothetical protein
LATVPARTVLLEIHALTAVVGRYYRANEERHEED